MTWRERRTITILTTILLILSAMLLIVLGIRYRQNRADDDGGPNDAAPIADVSTGFYSALTYSNGSTTLSFTQDETGAWRWDAGTDFPLDDATIQEILSILTNWHPQQTLKDQASLEASGLSESTGFLTATAAKGGATTLLFGKNTTDGASCYVRLNSDESTVYIIDNTIQRLMDVPIYDMCHLPELPILMESRISSITVQGPAPEADPSSQEGGEAAAPEAGPLTVLTAQHGNTASWRSNGANVTDDPTVRDLMKDLLRLRFAKCVDYEPSDEAAEICGFSNPQATLRVRHTQNGQEEEELVITVGNLLPDESGRYARLNGEDPIYLLEAELLDPLMQLAATGLEGGA